MYPCVCTSAHTQWCVCDVHLYIRTCVCVCVLNITCSSLTWYMQCVMTMPSRTTDSSTASGGMMGATRDHPTLRYLPRGSGCTHGELSACRPVGWGHRAHLLAQEVAEPLWKPCWWGLRWRHHAPLAASFPVPAGLWHGAVFNLRKPHCRVGGVLAGVSHYLSICTSTSHS